VHTHVSLTHSAQSKLQAFAIERNNRIWLAHLIRPFQYNLESLANLDRSLSSPPPETNRCGNLIEVKERAPSSDSKYQTGVGLLLQ